MINSRDAFSQWLKPLLLSLVTTRTETDRLFSTSIGQIVGVIEIRWPRQEDPAIIRLAYTPRPRQPGRFDRARSMIALLKKTGAPSTDWFCRQEDFQDVGDEASRRPGAVMKLVPGTEIVVYVAIDCPVEHEAHFLAETMALFIAEAIREAEAANPTSTRSANDRELIGAAN